MIARGSAARPRAGQIHQQLFGLGHPLTHAALSRLAVERIAGGLVERHEAGVPHLRPEALVLRQQILSQPDDQLTRQGEVGLGDQPQQERGHLWSEEGNLEREDAPATQCVR